jgi:hypothetical protein
METPSTSLDYANRPTTARRVFSDWRLMVALAILIAAIPIGMAVPQQWRALQHWQWRNKCLAFSLPPTTVIFDDDSLRTKTLLASGKYISTHPSFGWQRTSPVALLPIREFDNYAVGGRQAAPVVFLHERTSPAGHQGLVVVQFGRFSLDPLNRIFFFAYLDQIGVAGNASRSLGRSLEMLRLPGEKVTIYAGQADAKDSSHFTIDYLLNSRRETIDGWLNDDNSVYLIPRCGSIIWQIPNTIWMPGNSPGPPSPYRYYPPNMLGRLKLPPQSVPVSLGHANAPPTSRPAAMP